MVFRVKKNPSVQSSCFAGIMSHCQEIHSHLIPFRSPKYILQPEQSKQRQGGDIHLHKHHNIELLVL